MGPHLSFDQYRNLDLFFWALIAFVAELVVTLAAVRWFPDQLYTFSVTAAITSIVLIRWKGYALLHAFLGGLALCAASHATLEQYLIYCAGNLFAVAALFLVKAVGEKKIVKNPVWTVVYGLCTLLLMQTGRAVAALFMGYGFQSCVGFYATDSLSAVITAVILWIAGRLDGILEDQREYLIRIHKESESEKEETR